MWAWKTKVLLEACWTRGQRRAPLKPGNPARWTCVPATGLSSLTTCGELWMRFTSPVNLTKVLWNAGWVSQSVSQKSEMQTWIVVSKWRHRLWPVEGDFEVTPSTFFSVSALCQKDSLRRTVERIITGLSFDLTGLTEYKPCFNAVCRLSGFYRQGFVHYSPSFGLFSYIKSNIVNVILYFTCFGLTSGAVLWYCSRVHWCDTAALLLYWFFCHKALYWEQFWW